MSQTLYILVFIVACNIIVHALETSAQYNTNSISSSIQPAIPSSFDTSPNQQLISTNFPSTSNAISSSSATVSSSLLPPRLIPNAFTRAVLKIPSLQRFLNLRIPRFQGADLVFKAVRDAMKAIGHPNPATIANIVAQNTAGLDVFTIPLYLYIQGKLTEHFLISEGIQITPGLPQSYANTMEKALESYILNNNEVLHQAIVTGFINFIESLGFNFVQKTYILALIFSEDAIATVDALKP